MNCGGWRLRGFQPPFHFCARFCAHPDIGERWPFLEFARKRDAERQAALDRLSRRAFEAGLYDRNVMPEGGSDE